MRSMGETQILERSDGERFTAVLHVKRENVHGTWLKHQHIMVEFEESYIVIKLNTFFVCHK